MTDKDLRIANAMLKYGGSFVKELGVLIHLADDTNLGKLKAAFPEYWKQYEDMAEWEDRAQARRDGR